MDIARYIDHAVLKPEMSRAEAQEAIRLGIFHRVRTVCVRPSDIVMAVEMCRGSETEVSCVLAFPHGNTTIAVKAFEAAQYVSLGVSEIDMVANYGAIRSGDLEHTEAEIRAVVDAAKPHGVLVKVILETCTLQREEIMAATKAAIRAGADYVKTSTGFHNTGATELAVQAMVDAADGRIRIKASGGIRDRAQAMRYVEMGCDRLGVGYSTTPILCSLDGGSSAEHY